MFFLHFSLFFSPRSEGGRRQERGQGRENAERSTFPDFCGSGNDVAATALFICDGHERLLFGGDSSRYLFDIKTVYV